ncbi:unnamed protein product, partial [marine sediment metagenome]
MSAESKNSKTDDPRRPFDADTVAAAGRLAERYQIILVQDGGAWIGRGLELPNVYGDGKTPGQCIRQT